MASKVVRTNGVNSRIALVGDIAVVGVNTPAMSSSCPNLIIARAIELSSAVV